MHTKKRIGKTYMMSKFGMLAKIIKAHGPLTLFFPDEHNKPGMKCIYITDEDTPWSEEFNKAIFAFQDAFRKHNEEGFVFRQKREAK